MDDVCGSDRWSIVLYVDRLVDFGLERVLGAFAAVMVALFQQDRLTTLEQRRIGIGPGSLGIAEGVG